MLAWKWLFPLYFSSGSLLRVEGRHPLSRRHQWIMEMGDILEIFQDKIGLMIYDDWTRTWTQRRPHRKVDFTVITIMNKITLNAGAMTMHDVHICRGANVRIMCSVKFSHSTIRGLVIVDVV